MSELSLTEVFLWAAPAVGFVVHFTVGRYNARRVVDQWHSFPTTLDVEQLGQLRTTVDGDADCLDISLDSARQARSEDDLAELVRQAGLAHQVVAEATPDRLSRLKKLSLLIRMAAAVAPMPPLEASAFRTGRVSGLASLAAAFHFFLVSPAERLLLRLHMLRAGFRLILAFLSRRRSEIARAPGAVRPWKRFENGASDFKALDREHLDATAACLLSLRLEPRVGAIAQSAR